MTNYFGEMIVSRKHSIGARAIELEVLAADKSVLDFRYGREATWQTTRGRVGDAKGERMSAFGYKRTFTHTVIYVRFTPESRHREGWQPSAFPLERRGRRAKQLGHPP